jgi:hypothetical protein
MKFPSALISVFLGVAAVLPVCADTLTVPASSDTWIFSESADFSQFGDFHGLAAGVNSHGSPMHALFKFDVSQIPANATITSASVTLLALRQNFSAQSATFELHRVLKPWVAAEATWNSQSSGVPWSSPGAAAPADYSTTVSASNVVSDASGSTYIFGSTSDMVADVQAWVSASSANNGWIFKVSDESVLPTSRRWGSTTLGNPASLTVDFTASAPPPQQPTLSGANASNGNFQFAFNAEANRSYTVESRAAFDSSTWTPLTTFSAATTPTNYTVIDPIAQVTKFYRVRTP